MKFELIMNLPVRSKKNAEPALIQRMVVVHQAQTLKEFTMEISKRPFIVVEEVFPDTHGSWHNPVSNGEITVNTDLIGKAREWKP
jgi:hypothetical protein